MTSQWADEPTTVTQVVTESRGMHRAARTQRHTINRPVVVQAGRDARSLAWPRGVPVTPATPHRTVSTSSYASSRWPAINAVSANVLDLRSRAARRRVGEQRDLLRAAFWCLAPAACGAVWWGLAVVLGLWVLLLILGLAVVGLGLLCVWVGVGRGGMVG